MKSKDVNRRKKSRLLSLKMICSAMLIMIAQLAFAQSLTVKGNVKDSQGAPLPGVSVQIQGTSQGTLTDVDGNYSIAVPSSKSTLVFTFIGMETQKIVAGNQRSINLTMKDSSIALDEVVSIGYARIKKSDVTGAMSQVTEKTLKERPVQNAITAMQGKAAGVDIVTNQRPGEISAVVIRGTHSLYGGQGPLYVVDGVPLMGDMNDVNPNDIASMEILKDASSTAIYGSRGANGVVLITTKTGKKGKVSIDYTGAVTFDQINSTTDWASAGEMLDRYRLANINGGTYTDGTTVYNYPNPFADIKKFGNSDVATLAAIRSAYEWNDPGTFASVKTRATTTEEQAAGWPAQVPVYNASNIPTTNWTKLLSRTGITQNHQIGLSSGSDISKLYISLGYYKNSGTQKNQEFSRYSARVNGEITATKWLTFGTSLNATYSEQQYGNIFRTGSATGANDSYGIALSQYLMAKPYDDAGNLNLYPGNNQASPLYNPFIDLNNTSDLTRKANMSANAFADIRFTPWLKYRLNFGANYRNSNTGTWQGSGSTTRMSKGVATTAAAAYSTAENFSYVVENILYANKTFGVHDLGLTLMESAEYARTITSAISSSGIFYDACKWYNLAANSNGKPDSYSTGFTESSMNSWMARFNYSLMSKYVLSASLRYDGASMLAPGHKWESFPAASLAWKMQEESWLKKIKWIDEMKLRFGLGTSGNSRSLGAYASAGPLAQYAYTWNAVAAYGMLPYNMPNPNLKWEKTTQYNLGLDFEVLNRRLSGTVEVYLSNTYDNLMYRALPPITGYTQIGFNIGQLRNKGIEITLSSKNIVNKTFSWSTDLSITSNKNAIVSLVNGKQDMPGSYGIDGWYIGQSANIFRRYKIAGIWQNTTDDLAEIAKWKANGYNFAVGQYKPQEQGTPDYKLTDADKVIVGSTDPKVVLGLTNTFSYKNFEFSFFLYSRIGQKYLSSLIPGGWNGGSFVGYGRHADASEFWSPTNTTGKYPQPSTAAAATANAALTQASYVNDGTFCIVRNISLSYKVPAKFLNKMSIKSFQVYGQVMNPFMFGGAVVKAGLNPDDTNSWTSTNSVGDNTGGTNNNTILITSFVAGVRVGF